MLKTKADATIANLTDEEVLKEFVKRFQCEGAVLIYFSEGQEHGFGRWTNYTGKEWVNSVFSAVKENVYLIQQELASAEVCESI